ncbi:MAG: GNAT family N-acetyltransferase, partial [Armatimonadota bacterium]|nr:GNAT family N-acetyltransferase [Armatimonadota bacterium]
MERISVIMIRENLENLPRYGLPPGYGLRTYRLGDEAHWAEIETAAGEFASTERALAQFSKEFLPFPQELASRCFFLETKEGRAIGTATAWYHPSFRGEEYGRIHWVGIHPDFQGRGLSKPLVGAAMERLAQ